MGQRLVHWPRGVDADVLQPAAPARRRLRSCRGRSGSTSAAWPSRRAWRTSWGCRCRAPRSWSATVRRARSCSARYPDVVWRGYRYGDDLAAHFASADCFVFPSRTETFGNVLLEAMASGLPVASVPAPGPVDLINEGVNGAIDDDLLRCLPARARAARARRRAPASAADAARRPRAVPHAPGSAAAADPSSVPPRIAGTRIAPRAGAPGVGAMARRRPFEDTHQGSRSSGCPIWMTSPSGRTWSASANPAGAKTMIVDPSSNQPISSPLRNGASHGIDVGAAVAEVQQHVEEVQPDARDQDRRDRHQRDRAGPCAPGASRRTARSFLQNSFSTRLTRDRVGVPGVAGDVGDLLDAAVVRRVEAVVHAGRQPQRHVAGRRGRALDQLRIVQQVVQRVGEPLGLDQLVALDRAAGAHDGVARADQDVRVGVDRARARACSSRMKQSCRLANCWSSRLRRDRGRRTGARSPIDRSRTSGCSTLAEPSHELGGQPAGNAVGEQEVDVLLQTRRARGPIAARITS